jgi:DNA polymerase
MNRKEKLKKLNKKMLACRKCALREGCKQVVLGTGDPEAEIMFIGEAPGKKEDEIGVPFVGVAGKFLDEMLISINLKREDVYIANAVKCRPSDNRDPSQEEKDSCWQWLKKQVEIIQPKLIITLGRHSMNLFLPEQKISQAHGNVFKKEFFGLGQCVFFALYHPAAALYNGGMRETLKNDFKKIPQILKKLK